MVHMWNTSLVMFTVRLSLIHSHQVGWRDCTEGNNFVNMCLKGYCNGGGREYLETFIHYMDGTGTTGNSVMGVDEHDLSNVCSGI